MSAVELGVQAGGPEAKQRLRIWLRLLKLQRRMEAVLRERLRTEFNTTMPRFDVMAALEYKRAGLRMSELSSFLRVSNGNVTGIIDRLVSEGMVERVPVAGDRRAMTVRLTARGLKDFQHMARVHETWVDDLLAGLSREDATLLLAHLDHLNHSMRDQT